MCLNTSIQSNEMVATRVFTVLAMFYFGCSPSPHSLTLPRACLPHYLGEHDTIAYSVHFVHSFIVLYSRLPAVLNLASPPCTHIHLSGTATSSQPSDA